MRPKKQSLSAAGDANWIPVDFRGDQFGISIGVNVSGTLTYSIQHSFDSPYNTMPVTITRTTTTAVADFGEPHGKVVGDSINVIGIREDNLDGVHEITAVATNTVSYVVANTGSTSEQGKAILFSVFENDDLTALTASADGGYVLPPTVTRLSVSSYTSGTVTANFTFLSRGA